MHGYARVHTCLKMPSRALQEASRQLQVRSRGLKMLSRALQDSSKVKGSSRASSSALEAAQEASTSSLLGSGAQCHPEWTFRNTFEEPVRFRSARFSKLREKIAPCMAMHGSTLASRCPQERSKRLQDSSKSAQEASRRPQERFKIHQNWGFLKSIFERS